MRLGNTVCRLGQAKSYGRPFENFFSARAGNTDLSTARLTKSEGNRALASSKEQHNPSFVCARGRGDGKNLSFVRERYELLG